MNQSKEKNENQPNKQPAEQPVGPPVEQPVSLDHVCSICGSPDYQACGCEARELQKSIEQDDKETHKQATQELGHNHRERVPGRAAQEWAQAHVDQVNAILDKLHDIQTFLVRLVELQEERRDLLKDIQNAGRN